MHPEAMHSQSSPSNRLSTAIHGADRPSNSHVRRRSCSLANADDDDKEEEDEEEDEEDEDEEEGSVVCR